jgi:hypothetical protein
MLDEKLDAQSAKDMIYGASDPLYSSYHRETTALLVLTIYA